jgi:hypothetical protein
MNKFNLKLNESRKFHYFSHENFIFKNGEHIIEEKFNTLLNEIKIALSLDKNCHFHSKKIKKLETAKIGDLNKLSNKYDALISNFSIQIELINNPDYVYKNIYSILNENSFLCINLLTNESMRIIRNIFYDIDEKVFGGSFQRFGPFIEVPSIVEKFNQNKFKEIVVTIDRIEANYTSFSKLRSDFKSFGTANFYDFQIPFKKDFLIYAQKVFDKLTEKHKYIPLDLEIATLTAWK